LRRKSVSTTNAENFWPEEIGVSEGTAWHDLSALESDELETQADMLGSCPGKQPLMTATYRCGDEQARTAHEAQRGYQPNKKTPHSVTGRGVLENRIWLSGSAAAIDHRKSQPTKTKECVS
jgi:hypothetical protein